MDEQRDALTRAVEQVVAPGAAEIDAQGRFPSEAIEALGRAGILGLTTAPDAGGGGQGLAAAVEVIETLAGVCGSTAMVVLMHYAATAVIEAHGPIEVRRDIGAGRHLTTLAFSEVGSRSHFWAPMGTATATAKGDAVVLDAHKSWVTSAVDADSYVWSSRPMSVPGPMTLWLLPSTSAGLTRSGTFDGLGLRGNGSIPVVASGVSVPSAAMLGTDGAGLDIALAVALPWFLIGSAAFSLGVMEAVTAEAGAHLTAARLEHLGQSLIHQPMVRADYARMRIMTDTTRAMIADTLSAVGSGRADATLRVLEVKAVAGEAAIAVTDLAMKVCGGAAFRRELGIERHFRDARAARVMAPTTDALLDFVGRAIAGLSLLDA
jgi:isovaleryl-CoA dehydrogenase